MGLLSWGFVYLQQQNLLTQKMAEDAKRQAQLSQKEKEIAELRAQLGPRGQADAGLDDIKPTPTRAEQAEIDRLRRENDELRKGKEGAEAETKIIADRVGEHSAADRLVADLLAEAKEVGKVTNYNFDGGFVVFKPTVKVVLSGKKLVLRRNGRVLTFVQVDELDVEAGEYVATIEPLPGMNAEKARTLVLDVGTELVEPSDKFFEEFMPPPLPENGMPSSGDTPTDAPHPTGGQLPLAPPAPAPKQEPPRKTVPFI